MPNLDPDLLLRYKVYLRSLLAYQCIRKGFFALSTIMTFVSPSSQRTPFVIAQVLLGMTIVLTTALATSHISPGMLLTIPAYAIYATIILVVRQQNLNDARKIKVGTSHLYYPISPPPNPMHRRDMARKRK